MPVIKENQEAHIRRAVRDIIALDPIITLNGIQAALEKKYTRLFDWRYVKKVREKVKSEIISSLSNEKVGERIGMVREDYRMARESLIRIAFGEPDSKDGIRPSIRDRISAWKAISLWCKVAASAEADLLSVQGGSPVKKEAEAFRREPLPQEELDAIVGNMLACGITPPEMRQIGPSTPKPTDVLLGPVNEAVAATAPQADPITGPIETERKLVTPKLHGGFQIAG